MEIEKTKGYQRLLVALEDVLGYPVTPSSDTTLKKLKLDSLDVLELMVVIEEDLDIDLNDVDIIDDTPTLAELACAINVRLENKGQ